MNTSLSRCRNELFSNTKESPSQLNAEPKSWESYNHLVLVQILPKGNLSSSNGERDKAGLICSPVLQLFQKAFVFFIYLQS